MLCWDAFIPLMRFHIIAAEGQKLHASLSKGSLQLANLPCSPDHHTLISQT